MTIVVAGNYKEFKDWCQERGISPYSKDVVYATRNSLRGLQLSKEDQIVKIGRWDSNRDLHEILENIAILKATVK